MEVDREIERECECDHEFPSPRERLLNEIHHSILLDIQHRLSHIISQTARPADRDGHSAALLLDLALHDELDVRASREHLHRVAGRDNFPWVLRSRDEQLDGKAVSATWETEDLVHPWADPFEVLGVADDPDEGDLAGCDGAVVETVDEVLGEADLMRDSGCAGEEDDVPVGVEGVVARVRPFHRGFESQEAWRAGVGFVE